MSTYIFFGNNPVYQHVPHVNYVLSLFSCDDLMNIQLYIPTVFLHSKHSVFVPLRGSDHPVTLSSIMLLLCQFLAMLPHSKGNTFLLPHSSGSAQPASLEESKW